MAPYRRHNGQEEEDASTAAVCFQDESKRAAPVAGTTVETVAIGKSLRPLPRMVAPRPPADFEEASATSPSRRTPISSSPTTPGAEASPSPAGRARAARRRVSWAFPTPRSARSTTESNKDSNGAGNNNRNNSSNNASNSKKPMLVEAPLPGADVDAGGAIWSLDARRVSTWSASTAAARARTTSEGGGGGAAHRSPPSSPLGSSPLLAAALAAVADCQDDDDYDFSPKRRTAPPKRESASVSEGTEFNFPEMVPGLMEPWLKEQVQAAIATSVMTAREDVDSVEADDDDEGDGALLPLTMGDISDTIADAISAALGRMYAASDATRSPGRADSWVSSPKSLRLPLEARSIKSGVYSPVLRGRQQHQLLSPTPSGAGSIPPLSLPRSLSPRRAWSQSRSGHSFSGTPRSVGAASPKSSPGIVQPSALRNKSGQVEAGKSPKRGASGIVRSPEASEACEEPRSTEHSPILLPTGASRRFGVHFDEFEAVGAGGEGGEGGNEGERKSRQPSPDRSPSSSKGFSSDPPVPSLPQFRSSKHSLITDGTAWTEATLMNRSIDQALDKAIVVNFRRLIKFKEKIQIVHQVLKATSIAIFTLAAVDGKRTLVYDVTFFALSLMLYAFHEMSYDCLDTTDFGQIAEMVGRDGEEVLRGSAIDGSILNPNRCLQAMNYTSRLSRRIVSGVFVSTFITLAVVGWVSVIVLWMHGEDEVEWPIVSTIQLITEAHEFEHYNTLLLIGSLMALSHIVFEFFKWREFQFAPPSKHSEPWDVARHGMMPGRLNCIFGLPCVWFSSPAAFEDLRIWTTLTGLQTAGDSFSSRGDRCVAAHRRIFAEELAFYATENAANAARVRRCLLTSKIFDKRNNIFLKRPAPGEVNHSGRPGILVTGVRGQGPGPCGFEEFFEADMQNGDFPTELGLELVFFDNRTSEIIVPKLPDELKEHEAMTQTLRHARSWEFLGA
mmetsp:Transcript_70407/g.153503  ORF Transcript_70407/g.153503 Transcript_70407/m.153503 type:complete len:956 (-) Transcript_70407:217-3084(-)